MAEIKMLSVEISRARKMGCVHAVRVQDKRDIERVTRSAPAVPHILNRGNARFISRPTGGSDLPWRRGNKRQ